MSAPDPPVPVQVDAEQLQRALVNVLFDQFASARTGALRASIVPHDGVARTVVRRG